MILPSINVKFKNMHSRLKYSAEKTFSTPFYDKNKYDLLVINQEDIFFTTPALFLWIDTGMQQLTNASTNEKFIKIIHSEIFEIPKRDFKNITDDVSDILCLIDLTFNPNLSSISEMDNHLKQLETLKIQANNFFTGERWQKNTF